MTADDIIELVEVAISLAQTQLAKNEVASTLLNIVNKADAAYKDQMGQPLDPNLIGAEEPL